MALTHAFAPKLPLRQRIRLRVLAVGAHAGQFWILETFRSVRSLLLSFQLFPFTSAHSVYSMSYFPLMMSSKWSLAVLLCCTTRVKLLISIARRRCHHRFAGPRASDLSDSLYSHKYIRSPRWVSPFTYALSAPSSSQSFTYDVTPLGAPSYSVSIADPHPGAAIRRVFPLHVSFAKPTAAGHGDWLTYLSGISQSG